MDWQTLDQVNKKPRAFDPGDGIFWADPYIGSHVIWAHLDDRSDDASRPLAQVQKEVDWMNSQFQEPGKLLDLACGVGRHSLFFAQKGWKVTGIDVAETSLEYARTEFADAALEGEFLQGDVTQSALPGPSSLILLSYGLIGTLSPTVARRLISRCRSALAPGGRLIFDAFQKSWFDRQFSAHPQRTWDVLPKEGFWSSSPHLVLSRTDAYPKLRTFGRTYTIVESERIRRFPFWYRWYDPQYLKEELLATWDVQFFGGLDGSRWRSNGSWVAAVARVEE